jgi:SNF1-activating kinase 1
VHGKVKLARSLETGDFVAIKIIQRYSKKRRLGRVTVSQEDKTKREIAILKKIRHPNVVGLLEVIDDPELKKIYMVLEHVELGEIVWRKKGVPQICLYERRRTEREQRGEKDTGDDEKIFRLFERRRQRREAHRAKLSQLHSSQGTPDYWSLEHGEGDDDTEWQSLSRQATAESVQDQSLFQRSSIRSNAGSQADSRATSRAPSKSSSGAHTPLPEHDIPAIDSDNEVDTPGPLPSISSAHGSASASALEGTYYGSYPDEPPNRGRSPSMADSIISHMSSLDDSQHDAFEDDYSYVPCFTMEQARSAFRDTVLGLEYLHYEGIVHRDIKPGNLLWTKDHRVKISDFGVSYFGRPIREGEETVSEADATDFDDDLELAKTVGTPAFFAPELCYTDLDTNQPKVTEQIDVWSLGITLYCLIFARIPFLAEDEYQLFRAIAKDDVYIHRRRLKAVDPSSQPLTNQPARTGPTSGSCREDAELAYEDVDDELYDLLRRMLIKDPVQRIKLREVKRHPWVIRGIDNIIGWIDDTDPSRKTAGRRIQVDRAELDHAVIPISIIERARSAMKKAVGKVFSVTRSEARGEGSRRRAVSSATSWGMDSYSHPHSPMTPTGKEGHQGSPRGEESSFLGAVGDLHERREAPEHPLAQSSMAIPDLPSDDGKPFSLDSVQQSPSAGGSSKRVRSGTTGDFDIRPDPPERSVSTAESVRTIVPRKHVYSRSVTHTPSAIVTTGQSGILGPFTSDPFTDRESDILNGGSLWNSRGRDSVTGVVEHASTRARSVDRGIFGLDNKHAEPSVATSPAVAPGRFELSNVLHHPHSPLHSEISSRDTPHDKPLASPLFFQPHMVYQHQTARPSTPDLSNPADAVSNLEERPTTPNRTLDAKTPTTRVCRALTPQSFELAQESLRRRREIAAGEDKKRKELMGSRLAKGSTTGFAQSPDEEILVEKQEATRAPSSSSVNSNGFVTSPSDMTSNISSVALGSHGQFSASVPSLPALISSGSSVCADPEGDFLQQAVSVSQAQDALSHGSTPETLTPPLYSKHAINETDTPLRVEKSLAIDVDEEGYNGDGDTAFTIDDEVDSDSDEGLTMTRKKRHAIPNPSLARRGTDVSAASTDTAKKVELDG